MNETIINIIDLGSPTVRALWTRSYIPYVSFHFLLIPILFLPLGITAAINILLNRLVAELITNVHSFVMISPNHTADDLFRYEDRYKRRDKFYIAQVLSSANYRCGNERIDFISLWLNYQIEHHLIPDLPMSKYREIQPIIKSICQKYGLPYRQESIVKRFKRMARVATGQAGGLKFKWRETEVTQEWSKIAK